MIVYPKLTSQERRCIELWDHEGQGQRNELRADARYRKRQKAQLNALQYDRPLKNRDYYVAGEPIEHAAIVCEDRVTNIRSAHADGVSVDALSIEHDLRVEWIERILSETLTDRFYF